MRCKYHFVGRLWLIHRAIDAKQCPITAMHYKKLLIRSNGYRF